MDLQLKDKVALITGGSKGIGRSVAERLTAEGCDVMIVARSKEALEKTAREVAKASGRRVEICATDLRSSQGCAAAVGALRQAFGRLDILVNNAGATQSGDFFQQDDAVWEDGFALKFYGYVRLSRALWPLLKAREGSVVNVIGAASKTPNVNFMIGGAVNAACTNFTKALANLGLRDGVQVNALHPGPVVTDRLNTLLDQRAKAEGIARAEYEKKELAASGMRAFSKPEEIAAAIAFLVSPLSRQVHGADVFCDGGSTKTIL